MRYSDRELEKADEWLGMSPEEQMYTSGKQQVHDKNNRSYFVAYNFIVNKSYTGFGQIEILCDGINTYKDVIRIREYIENDHCKIGSKVVITNWIELETKGE